MQINFIDHEKDIVFKAKKSLIPGMDWEDIAQELRLQLWLKKDKFQLQKASTRTFANRVLENKIKDLGRRANRQKRYLDSYHFVFSELESTESGQVALDLALSVI